MYRIEVRGVVQGVGFRPSVKRAADQLNAKGWVRNDGSHVTIVSDTGPDILKKNIEQILGPMGRIEDWIVSEIPAEEHTDFRIIPSKEGERDSSLPPDTAICNSCLKEMTTPGDRRYLYPFTNCTDCGARYTLIDSLPYDRERTSMSDFPMCRKCTGEYSDQTFRRFHAQTLSCPENGPGYRYVDKHGNNVAAGYGSFLRCADDIVSGKIIIVKGWGGMHIICDPARVDDLRKWYGRPYKPFALMCRDEKTAGSLAHLPAYAEFPLVSPARPIVLLEKRSDVDQATLGMLESISPGIGTVGVYLPFSGIHHILFRALEENGSDLGTIIMTSANPPGEPMALELEDAMKMNAHGYLVHDRRISARCDDSVLVPNPFGIQEAGAREGPFHIRSLPIRKARGLIPDPVSLPHERRILAFGAERNVTVTVTSKGRAFTSPYIGNSRHPDVLDYMEYSADRFIYLFGGNTPEAISADLHPRYGTVPHAREWSEKLGIPLLRYQHHEAHAASLLADYGAREMPILVLDGVGYGHDGISRGGEIICASWTKMEHLSSLEKFGLPGGDSSVYHPERIAHWLTAEVGKDLDIGDAGILLRRTHERARETTSFGRLLDAMSSLLLGITWRTYDGEPAMRLERLLGRAKEPSTSIFNVPLKDGRVDVIRRWSILLEELFGSEQPKIGPVRKSGVPDLAMGLLGSVLDDMIEISLERTSGDRSEKGHPCIGISGGVAYDIPIVRYFVSSCAKHGAFPVLHSRVPPGDGGISLGQAALAGMTLEKEVSFPQT